MNDANPMRVHAPKPEQSELESLRAEVARLRAAMEGVVALNASCNAKLEQFHEVAGKVEARLKSVVRRCRQLLLRASRAPLHFYADDVKDVLAAADEVLKER